MSTLRSLLLFFCLLLPAPPAALAQAVPGAAAAERAGALGLEVAAGAEAVTVIDGDTLVLADEREVRLVGIQTPKLPLGRAGFEAWPLAGEAKRKLEEIALGRVLDLGFGGRRGDRPGRVLAHLFAAEGRWLQGEMLSAGLARVYSFSANRTAVAEMLAQPDRRSGRDKVCK